MYDSKIEKSYNEPKRGGCADCSYGSCSGYCEGGCSGCTGCTGSCAGTCETFEGVYVVNEIKR